MMPAVLCSTEATTEKRSDICFSVAGDSSYGKLKCSALCFFNFNVLSNFFFMLTQNEHC